ncbi:MAG: hypothetical protein KJZ54_00795 [Phycisphaerales bacterium]|nr:hypothetical protein [Phycisphaerales bacterium]
MPRLTLHHAIDARRRDDEPIPFPKASGPVRLRLTGGERSIEAVEDAFGRVQRNLDAMAELLGRCDGDRPTAA